ncbi:MAG: Rieske (2Fe-2S) protein [Pseudomonadota bacterium]
MSEQQWIDVGALDEWDDPGARGFTHDDWDHWGMVVRVGDQFAAYRNVCPHAGHPLQWAPHQFLTNDASLVICSSHGAAFDRLSGECVAGPCVGRRLMSVPVRVQGDRVEVAPAG